MYASDQLEEQVDLMAKVLASADYQERCSILFPFFRLTRQIDGDPKDILAIQGELAELLMQFQQKKAEFEQEGNDVGIAIVKRLILVLKRIADSLVWRLLGFDRVLIQLLSEHSKTGYLDDTVAGDFEMAQEIVEQEGAVVLVNDLTTILRHGDLTRIGQERITLVETKYGRASKRSRRATRQRKRLEELSRFVNTGVRVGEDRRGFIFKADVSVQSHHSAAAQAITKARSQGYHRVVVSDIVAIEALWTREQGDHSFAERPLENAERVTQSDNLRPFYTPVPRIAPYGIFPLDDRSCWDLITGSIWLVTTVSLDGLQRLYREFGLELELPQPSHQETQAYLSAPIEERVKQMYLYRFIIRGERCHASMTPDLLLGRIGLELIDEQTIVRADRQFMNLMRDLPIYDDKPTRFYSGFIDETDVWL